MHLITSLILLALLSCNGNINKTSSQTLLKAEDFHFQNLTNFVIDSAMWVNYYSKKDNALNLKKITSKAVDSAFHHDDLYLLSWQKRDGKFTEFTILSDNGDPGLSIHYLILDKTGQLISNTKVAGLGKDAGGLQFETNSYFKSLDTLVSTRAQTMLVDYETLEPLIQPKGDTSIYNFVISKNGLIKEHLVSEKKQLDLLQIR